MKPHWHFNGNSLYVDRPEECTGGRKEQKSCHFQRVNNFFWMGVGGGEGEREGGRGAHREAALVRSPYDGKPRAGNCPPC